MASLAAEPEPSGDSNDVRSLDTSAPRYYRDLSSYLYYFGLPYYMYIIMGPKPYSNCLGPYVTHVLMTVQAFVHFVVRG